MAIDFNFNKTLTTNTVAAAKSDRPKAQFWMNVGYEVTVEVDGQQEKRFVSLPMGMPLDTMEKLSTRSNNVEFRALQSARNNLLEKIMEAANQLKPGETQLVNLQVEVRRVNDEPEQIAADINPFVVDLKL